MFNVHSVTSRPLAMSFASPSLIKPFHFNREVETTIMRTPTFWPLGRLFAASLQCDQGLWLGKKPINGLLNFVGQRMSADNWTELCCCCSLIKCVMLFIFFIFFAGRTRSGCISWITKRLLLEIFSFSVYYCKGAWAPCAYRLAQTFKGEWSDD